MTMTVPKKTQTDKLTELLFYPLY